MVKKGDFEYPSHLSHESRLLVCSLLAQCPSKRPSVREVAARDQLLRHEWFKKTELLESTVDTNKNNLTSTTHN